MKYKFKTLENRLGEKRTIEKFLWFPKILNRELRWLEKAKIIQMICQVDDGGSMEWGCYKYKWIDIEWTE